jgi:hypothetical protein
LNLEELQTFLLERLLSAILTTSATPADSESDETSDGNVVATTQQNLSATFVAQNAEITKTHLLTKTYKSRKIQCLSPSFYCMVQLTIFIVA